MTLPAIAPGAEHRFAPPRVTAPHTDATSAVLAGGASWVPMVLSSLGDADAVQVPIIDGSVTYSQDMDAQWRLAVTVPRFADGRDWFPGADAEHPLARFGQELSASVHVTGGPVDEVFQVGTGHIQSWDLAVDGGSVSVEALGVMMRVAEAGFAVPQAVRPGGTFGTELTRLFRYVAPLVIDDGLTDRAAPAGMAWGDDRLEAAREIEETWPCRLRTDAYGVVWALPPLGDVPEPVARLADGEGGTVVGAPVADARAGVPNRVVVRGEAVTEDRPAVQGYAQIDSGPMSVHGPYGTVTHLYTSQLLTTRDQCIRSANGRLKRMTARSRTIPVTCAPDPRLCVPDLAVEVIHDGRRDWGWVVGFELPLVVGSGPMRVDVEVPY